MSWHTICAIARQCLFLGTPMLSTRGAARKTKMRKICEEHGSKHKRIRKGCVDTQHLLRLSTNPIGAQY